ncbi:hypothetical protein C2869_21405 [Saccharobesus litoralis]|uniref:Dual-action ribosomal maturation protein DarP n=1 Tax=Saccharobesus litoralis TaxID=2172099 RepID=A0A2S0VX44_9ALTE|nr:ribosome biogenesis factor YjgA [Saccharobesus litoralis]AWB68797.1 hypothetical protein C2869_21405 [Saccharobesus litoralis]
MSDNWQEDEPQEEIIYVSKSEIKRDMEELREFANELVELSQTKLAKLPLNQEQKEAVELGKKIYSKKDAYRRHLQYFSKILFNKDLSEIHHALNLIKQAPQLSNQHYQKLEELRDELIAQGDTAIHNLLNDNPELDRQKLRQLVRQAQKDQQSDKPTKKPAQQIFKYLKEVFPYE